MRGMKLLRMAMTFIAVVFLFSIIGPQTGLSGQATWGATAAERALNGIKASTPDSAGNWLL
jgi:hypothetical protein